MSSNLKISKKIKREAILWLFDELPEKKKDRFKTTIKELPPLQEYVSEMEKTLKLVDRLPMKYPSKGITKKNRVMVTGRIDSYQFSSSFSRRIDSLIGKVEDFLSTRFKLILFLSAIMVVIIIGWYYPGSSLSSSAGQDNNNNPQTPALTFKTKEQKIQGMIEAQTLKVSKIRELRDNTNRITFTVDSDPEIFYVSDVTDKLGKNILYYVVRHDENPGTRLNALKILAKDDNDPTLKNLTINILLSEKNPGIRLRAIRILEKFALDSNLKNICIKVLLEDENNVMRMEALSRLSVLKDEDLIPIYQVVSQYEQNEYIRQEAERLLNRINSQEDPTT